MTRPLLTYKAYLSKQTIGHDANAKEQVSQQAKPRACLAISDDSY